MPPSAFWQAVRNSDSLNGCLNKRFFATLCGVLFLVILICIQMGPLFGSSASAQITALNHTSATLDEGCRKFAFSSDGNPFPLCPGPLPTGGNCVWWGWEMWHLLGYDLPLNWGNAADWISDAERSGLPLGTTPRVGSIAVFPVADGVWAFGPAGHVAFVTAVSADNSKFNVTYQNYGDPTPMHIGVGYPVSVINEPRYQNGNMRFIYFPRPIDPSLFERLPGIDGNDLTGIANANYQLSTWNSEGLDTSRFSRGIANQIALGLSPSSSDQEYNADFTGTGLSDLLLYNRAKGTLKILSLSSQLPRLNTSHLPRFAANEVSAASSEASSPQLISLSDKTTPPNGWGSSLEIHMGNFTGTNQSDILLYDRVTGKLQLLSLTPQLTIQRHVTLTGWGPNWELYVGSFGGNRSSLFMYNRQVNTLSTSSLTPTTDPTAVPTFPTGSTPSPSPTPKPSPTAGSSPTPTPKPSSSPTPSPTPKPSPSPSPTPKPCATPTPTSEPAGDVAAMLKRCTTPTPTPTSRKGSGQNLDPDTLLQTAGPNAEIPLDNDLSSTLSGSIPSALASNAMLLDFDSNFNVHHFQQYTLLDNAWEVYVGRFVNAHQDGLLLYDRTLGEVHLVSFDADLHVAHNRPIQPMAANWVVYSGDFMGSGRSQILLYDPTNGSAEILILKSDLAPAYMMSYSGWGKNQVLYIGHFGASTLSVMLYDMQKASSTFLEFDKTLTVVHQVTTHSWSRRWQILIGSFLDRSRCLSAHNCSTGDDILVLDHKTGQLEQFTFAFGNQYHVYDNRLQAFERTKGAPASESLTSIDTSTFSLLSTLSISIRGEELY